MKEKERALTEIEAELITLQEAATRRADTESSPTPTPTSSSDSKVISPRVDVVTNERIDEATGEDALPAPLSKSVKHAIVYADLLWVREGPGANYLRLSSLDDGVMVSLTGNRQPGWVEISAPEEGWVASDFIEFIAPPTQLLPSEAAPPMQVEMITPPLDSGPQS